MKKEEDEIYFLIDLLINDIGNQLQLILDGGDLVEKDSHKEQILRSKRYVMDGDLRCIEALFIMIERM